MFTKINCDTNGNPRYVCHFCNLLTEEESRTLPLDQQYNHALFKAKAFGGKKFHNKQFGGGIAFSSYNIKELEQDIRDLAK